MGIFESLKINFNKSPEGSEVNEKIPNLQNAKIKCQNCGKFVEVSLTHSSSNGRFTATNCPECKDPVVWNSRTSPEFSK